MSAAEVGTTSPGHAGPGPPGESPLVLAVDHLTKRYGSNTVVDDLSFRVEPGRVTGFLGPNGSGKSTTMKMLLGLAAAESGTATIGGQRYRDLADPARTVGAALESNAFHPGRTGRNHLRILADAVGFSTTRVDETIELVGLAHAADRNAGAYSLGMKQRLGLAAALLGDPPVLVLDEPGNGLDPQGVRTLRDQLRASAASGNTVLVSSHLLAEVEHLADDVVVINEGRLVASGALEDMQHAAALVRTPDVDQLVSALSDSGATTEHHERETVVVRGLSLEEVGERAFRAGVVIHELSAQAGSLEELFLGWTSTETPTQGGPPEPEPSRP
ncbi:MAG: ATP-binding cassette domain-containing protein [Acidimicrobiia bacterium]|nr:ATP-binding cassette domain-containing protein [Acidimicrobiia bacterium]